MCKEHKVDQERKVGAKSVLRPNLRFLLLDWWMLCVCVCVCVQCHDCVHLDCLLFSLCSCCGGKFLGLQEFSLEFQKWVQNSPLCTRSETNRCIYFALLFSCVPPDARFHTKQSLALDRRIRPSHWKFLRDIFTVVSVLWQMAKCRLREMSMWFNKLGLFCDSTFPSFSMSGDRQSCGDWHDSRSAITTFTFTKRRIRPIFSCSMVGPNCEVATSKRILFPWLYKHRYLSLESAAILPNTEHTERGCGKCISESPAQICMKVSLLILLCASTKIEKIENVRRKWCNWGTTPNPDL